MRCLSSAGLALSLLAAMLLVLLPVAINSALAFDREVITLKTNGAETRIEAEIAVTSAERQQGLMDRSDFAPGDAMLFVFPKARVLSFWMKNTPVSLDIAFFDAEGHWLNTVLATVPFSLDSVYSDGAALYALEVTAGEAARLGIGAGTRLSRAAR